MLPIYHFGRRLSRLSTLFAVFVLSTLGLSAQEFVNPIIIPPLIESDDTAYHLIAVETFHNFNPMGTDSLNTLVPAFAFVDADNPTANTILGPTIQWDYLSNLTPRVTNGLSETTTCHWHGAHVPQYADGGPHQRIQPGEDWNIEFPVLDKSATMWYHPHAMDLTYRHVQMGMSGMIYVEDPVDDPQLSFVHMILPTEYGVDDIPLIVQTKQFIENDLGELQINASFPPGYKSDYAYMVNGRIDPVLEVPADMLRLRVLNGDSKFAFNFGLSRDPAGNVDQDFHLIATDAGYTTRSHEKSRLLMAPGERTEWLVDLRNREGDSIYLWNYANGIPEDVIGSTMLTDSFAQNRALLKIKIGPSTQPSSPIIGFPIPVYTDPEKPTMDMVSNTRTKVFRRDTFIRMRDDGSLDTIRLYNIDSTLMDMTVVNDVVMLDSTEIWTIKNESNRAHPWHIHDIHFWVTEIKEDGEPLSPGSYPELFDGPKDNVLVMPGWELSYIATFDDYGTGIRFDSSYMYHCHILPHEDQGMMGQFVVWNGNPLTSTEEPTEINRDMKVFPNPSNGDAYLEGSSTETSIIYVFNAAGSLVRTLQLPPFDGVMHLELSGLQKGMLILDWRSTEGRAVKRVITR
ncbi:MAG: multicopper oxidase domain-containing protein [Bacteroidota bacterium]